MGNSSTPWALNMFKRGRLLLKGRTLLKKTWAVSEP